MPAQGDQEEIDITVSDRSTSPLNPNTLAAVAASTSASELPPTTPNPSLDSDAGARDIRHSFLLGDKKVPGSMTVCLGCREKGKTQKYSCKSGYSSLRLHLENDHKEEYLRVCKEKGWKNQLPKMNKAAKASLAASGSQDPSGQDVHQRQSFSQHRFLQHLTRFIVADDQPINVIECPEFRNLLRLLRPDLADEDIPDCTKLRELIIKVAKRDRLDVGSASGGC